MMEEWKEWYSTKEEWMAWHQEGLAQLLGAELQVCLYKHHAAVHVAARHCVGGTLPLHRFEVLGGAPEVLLVMHHQSHLHQPWRLNWCNPSSYWSRRASIPWRRWRPRPCCPPQSRSSRPRGREGCVLTCPASLPLLLMAAWCGLCVLKSLGRACRPVREPGEGSSMSKCWRNVLYRMSSRRAGRWQHLTHGSWKCWKG